MLQGLIDENTVKEFAHVKANQANVIEAHRKLDSLAEQLGEALEKLDNLLCPFNDTGLDFTVLRQGCDGIDQDCDKMVDECKEDQVPPSVTLRMSIPTTPFQSIGDARDFIEKYIDVSDDCAADLEVATLLVSEPTCTECIFNVTATDQRCVSEAFPGAATTTRSFTLKVDSSGPVITCGFFTPQDPYHVPGGFDPCEGLPPPFPAEGDFLHIDQDCFDDDFINVEFWYQIEVSTPKNSHIEVCCFISKPFRNM